jgi:hypothetical protein
MDTTSPAEHRHLTVAPAPSPPCPTRALGLSEYDRSAITAFVTGEPGEINKLIADTRQLAEALAGPDGDGARVRLLSRHAAACRTQLRILEELLAQRMAARDFESVAALNRTLDGVAKRMVMAVKLLGVESALRRRPMVTLTRTESVTFSGEAP